MVSAPLLSLSHVAKRFANGTQALVDASLEIRPGEVHGLLGANGAGKSTLIAILSGALSASDGTICWHGTPVTWRRPIDARRGGVATLYQHIPLVPTLSALENILLDRAGGTRRQAAERAEVAAIVARLGDPFALDALVADLPIGARQMVAIAQALASGAELVVMDEPTASLAAADRATVYDVVRQLARAEGKAVLFVSHFLDEILALTDRVTVLRDGRDVLCCATETLDEATLAAAISGREVPRLQRRSRAPAGAQLLSITGLESPGRLAPLDLDVRAGEIVGIAGMLGSGRSEALHAIFGADEAATGGVLVDGVRVNPGTDGAVAAGIALVPEDRKRQGYVAGMSIVDNIALPRADHWLIDRNADRAAADAAIARLAIKADGADAAIETLSGGNAQKVVIGKWLRDDTRVLLLDEPTAGIDIGARIEIMHLVRDLADRGMAIVLISSDFAELIAMSDRLLVMRDGAVVATADPATTSEIDLTMMAGGSAVAAGAA
jgi:ribose transport system ATP-binding protein